MSHGQEPNSRTLIIDGARDSQPDDEANQALAAGIATHAQGPLEPSQSLAHRHVGGWVVLALGLLLLGLVQGMLRPRGQASDLDTSEISLSVNLNTATVAELCCIPHVGPKLAERIVAYREAHGPFRSLADLDLVPGVGPSMLEEISQAIEPLPEDASPMAMWPSSSAVMD